jgi:hypothetical protein
MNPSKLIGLAFLVAGVVLQPIGWAYVHWLTPISFVAIALGIAVLFLASRELRAGSREGVGSARSGREMPGDIHGYSGQQHGGRSTSWESHHSSGGAGGSGGDGGGSD